MRKMDLQKQATMLIGQLSTEKLKEAIDYLAKLQYEDASDELPADTNQQIPLGTAIHALFKPLGGVELDIPQRNYHAYDTMSRP